VTVRTTRPLLALSLVFLLAQASGHASDWDDVLAIGEGDPGEQHYRDITDELRGRPARDLMHDPVSRRFLRKHPVFVSLTTSPDRIDKVVHVLDTLDLTHVDRVFLVLPERFGRTGRRYSIPRALRDHPKVDIIRIDPDLGPISKMLPAIERAARIDRKAIVISIDDDIGYPRGMIPEMIYHMARSRRTVVAGSAPGIDRFGIDPARWKFRRDREGRIVEGWAGIAYRAGNVDTDLLRRLSALDKHTFASDDLVISYVLAATGVKKRAVQNEYFDRRHVRHFPHGMGQDALHRGAGVSSPSPRGHDVTAAKYGRSLEALNQHHHPERGAAARLGRVLRTHGRAVPRGMDLRHRARARRASIVRRRR